jgi:cell division protein FtsN
LKESIPFYVIRYLDQFPELYLPGLGRFYQLHTSAIVDPTQKLILPPANSAHFEMGNQEGVNSFVSFLFYQTGQSRKNCSNAIRSFVSSILQQLKMNGLASVPHLGDFQVHADNKVEFFPDKDASNARFMAFRAVPMPMTEVKVEEVQEREPNLNLTVSQPIIATTVETDEVVPSDSAEVLPDIPEPQPMPQDHTKVEEPALEEPIPAFKVEAASAVTLAAMESQKYHTTIYPNSQLIQKGNRSKRNATRRISGWFFGSIILLLLLLALIFWNDQRSERKMELDADLSPTIEENDEHTANTSPVEVITEVPLTVNSESDPTPVSEMNESELVNRPVSETRRDSSAEPVSSKIIATQNGDAHAADCMIVVGAFKSQANVERMQAKLTSLGMVPYVLQRGSLTHVGVLQPCRTAKLRTVLYDVRSAIAEGAWVLRVAGQSPVQN